MSMQIDCNTHTVWGCGGRKILVRNHCEFAASDVGRSEPPGVRGHVDVLTAHR